MAYLDYWSDEPLGKAVISSKLAIADKRGSFAMISQETNMRTQVSCPIWGTSATFEGAKTRDGECFDSPRAGGRYWISGLEMHLLEQDREKYDERCKARLTSWLIDQRDSGDKCPEIKDDRFDKAKRAQDLKVHKRADRLLRYLESQIHHLGDTFKWQSGANSHSKQEFEALAYSESIKTSELSFLFDYLKRQGWTERKQNEITITVEGYARLEELRNAVRESSQAFVAMWFNKSTDKLWEQGIEPGIREAGYKPLRIDKTHHANRLDDQIVAEIRRSRFVVADFTHGKKGARGSVYYEAGFAHGLNIRVIFTCRKDMVNDIHFDTRQYPHIVWDEPKQLGKKLSERISALIGDGPLKGN